ncbi:MAG: phosphoribosylanthranilate isomerase [Candidatus Aminicenantes bacterium]|nr:phosphoribosylanthranilate isomerase [Candidatus Aminicenantes bacterium]
MLKVKICGITNAEDYLAAASLGADFVGFVFYGSSLRCVSPQSVQSMSKQFSLPVKKVGVFVNESIENIKKIVKEAELDIVQLHGDESPDFCRELDLPYWKVIRVRDRKSLEQMNRYDCRTFLLDTFVQDKPGGTSLSFDWKIAREAVANGFQIVIAGGISSENIEALSSLQPYGIDVSSWLEEYPGKKSREKMLKFFSIIQRIRGENEQR